MKTVSKLIKTFCLIISFLMLGTAANAATVVVGDVNGDGSITMSDANVVVNYYLATTKPSDFNKAAGDVNNDGDITMSDANIIVNMFLSGNVTYIVDGHEAVDLGLSVKWATCNIGAEHPQDLGNYFAWGETKPKSNYSWSTYKWCNGTSSSLKKYTEGNYLSAVVTLEPADDAAAANWGGTWHMPSHAEMVELWYHCYWEWTNSYNGTGVKGWIVYKVKAEEDEGVVKKEGGSVTTSATYSLIDTHIFMPSAGWYRGTELRSEGDAMYWTSTISSSPAYAWYLECGSEYMGTLDHCDGLSVRAVCP